MKTIIFANRSDCFECSGGDTIQMLKTKEYLEKNYEIKVKICLSPEEILMDKEADIVHIFNIQTIDQTLEYIEASKKMNKKILLSTIYWDLDYSILASNSFKILNHRFPNKNIENLKNLFNIAFTAKQTISNLLNNEKSNKIKMRKAIQEADYILPNSNEEFEIICRKFGINKEDTVKKVKVIPNAVEILETEIDKPDNDYIDVKIKDYILQVGRIEINKNQMSVIKALKNRPDIPIVFIGKVGRGKENLKYFNNIKKMAEQRGNVYFIDHIPQNEVYAFYKNAKVHVLPSFRESPGLSTLEALYHGCKIVTSSEKYCPVKYYQFDEKAYTCNPFDVKSIEKAILSAYNATQNTEYDVEYFRKFSYANVADIMNKIYYL